MLYLTQLIFIHEGKEDVFFEFENLVIPLMKQYHGKMLYRVRPSIDHFIDTEEELPFEIHIVTFDSEEDFTAYMNDKTRLNWIYLKEEAVKWTLVVKGGKF